MQSTYISHAEYPRNLWKGLWNTREKSIYVFMQGRDKSVPVLN
jgi:hypothetical protein